MGEQLGCLQILVFFISLEMCFEHKSVEFEATVGSMRTLAQRVADHPPWNL